MARPIKEHRTAPNGGVPVAVTYRRVSSDDQEREGTSLEAQRAEVMRYVGQQGWQFDSDWSDVLTGKNDARPGYVAMLARVRELRAQGHPVKIVVRKMDRLGRHLQEGIRCREELERLGGVQIHTVVGGGKVTSLTANVEGAVDQHYLEQLGDQIRRSWNNAARGGWFKVGPWLPWGFRSRLAEDEERLQGAPRSVIEPDPDVAPYVAEVFQRYAAGESLYSIAAWTATLPGDIRGQRWSDGRKVAPSITDKEPRQRERKVGVSQLRRNLGNPIYIGRLEYNARNEDGVQERKECVGRWQPIVDQETWDRVQVTLRRHREAPRADPQQYLLTGLVACGVCGSGLVGQTVERRNGVRQRRYRCKNAAGCQVLNAEQIEAVVVHDVGVLLDLFTRLPGRSEQLAKWEKQRQPQVDKNQERERQRLQERVDGAGRRISNAVRLLVDGVIDKAAYDGMVAEERSAQAACQVELERLQPASQTSQLPPFDVMQKRIGSWQQAFKNADPRVQREVLESLVAKVVATRVKHGQYAVETGWSEQGHAIRFFAWQGATPRLEASAIPGREGSQPRVAADSFKLFAKVGTAGGPG